MNTYKISFEQLRLDDATSEMLTALEEGLNQFNIDYYLVGAVSRNVWVSGVHGIKPERTTADMDFGVLINDKGLFEELRTWLLENQGFTGAKENAFVLIWKNGLQVKIIWR